VVYREETDDWAVEAVAMVSGGATGFDLTAGFLSPSLRSSGCGVRRFEGGELHF
jgi:hypothetical protein